MKDQKFYSEDDFPSLHQKKKIWNSVEQELPVTKSSNVLLHWRSFVLGNVAAVLLIFAGIGMYDTFIESQETSSTVDEQMYKALSEATKQLQDVTPLLIQQAQEQNKPSIESTASAIEEIDRLIEEIKTDIDVHGSSPTKELSLKRLYATKLDFYREILLNQEEQS